MLGDGSRYGRAAALRRGARAARHRRRAEVRRGAPRRALPDAQRRRADRHRPDARRSPSTSAPARAARSRSSPVDDPTRLRPRAPRRRQRRCAGSSRSRAADQIDTEPDLAPAPTCSSARSLDLIPPDRNVSIEREVWPRLVGDGLYGFAAERLLARHRHARALPAGTFDILEGNVQTDGRGGTRAGRRVIGGAGCDDRRRRARRAASSCSATASRSAPARASSARVVLAGQRDRRRLRARATASSRAGARIGDGTIDQRRRRARRGRDGRRGQRPDPRHAGLSRDDARRRRDQVLRRADRVQRRERRGTGQPAQPRGDRARSTRSTSSTTSSRSPSTCATRCGRSSRPTSSRGTARAAWSSPAWAARRSAARSRAPRSATPPRGRSSPRAPTACRRGRRPTRRCCARSYSGDTEETLAAYEAAGALGAKRVVVTTGGELAEQARADGVPVIPVAGGFSRAPPSPT